MIVVLKVSVTGRTDGDVCHGSFSSQNFEYNYSDMIKGHYNGCWLGFETPRNACMNEIKKKNKKKQ
jgi:hypothetical protein